MESHSQIKAATHPSATAMPKPIDAGALTAKLRKTAAFGQVRERWKRRDSANTTWLTSPKRRELQFGWKL
jgi:hypothetical protein